MKQITNIVGNTYGRLRVVSFASRINKRTKWNCICTCGKSTVVEGNNLKSGHVQSCGCFGDESRLSVVHGQCRGGRETTEHSIWAQMLARTSYPKNDAFARYGGRGIIVCERWLKFENFYADMGARPKGLTLDRINNDGNCEPSNCRWASRKVQANNRRSNKPLTFNGVTKSRADWSADTGIALTTIIGRLQRKWSVEKTLTTPTNR